MKFVKFAISSLIAILVASSGNAHGDDTGDEQVVIVGPVSFSDGTNADNVKVVGYAVDKWTPDGESTTGVDGIYAILPRPGRLRLVNSVSVTCAHPHYSCPVEDVKLIADGENSRRASPRRMIVLHQYGDIGNRTLIEGLIKIQCFHQFAIRIKAETEEDAINAIMGQVGTLLGRYAAKLDKEKLFEIAQQVRVQLEKDAESNRLTAQFLEEATKGEEYSASRKDHEAWRTQLLGLTRREAKWDPELLPYVIGTEGDAIHEGFIENGFLTRAILDFARPSLGETPIVFDVNTPSLAVNLIPNRVYSGVVIRPDGSLAAFDASATNPALLKFALVYGLLKETVIPEGVGPVLAQYIAQLRPSFVRLPE